MKGILVRNLKIFFRDKTAVFFSLLSVFIIIGLYVLFLRSVWTSNFQYVAHPQILTDNWIMAGLLAVTSVTTTMGVFGIMVEDRSKKISKDFYSAPIQRQSIAGGYVASSFVVGVIMSLVALILIEGYLIAYGSAVFSIITTTKLLGVILLTSLCSTAMMYFLVTFMKSQNAFATASTIIGTLIGFVTGIYLPVGMLPEAVQVIVKVFPISHAVALFRQIFMESPSSLALSGVPAEYIPHIKETLGVEFKLGGTVISPLASILILLGTAVLFYVLAVWNVSQKNKR